MVTARARVHVRRGLCALALFTAVGCLPDGAGTSSSGGALRDGGEGGSASDAPDVPAARVALCQQYGDATASCCQRGVGGVCPASTPAYWNDVCLRAARTCTGMPTCFSGPDCNSLIYCSSPC